MPEESYFLGGGEISTPVPYPIHFRVHVHVHVELPSLRYLYSKVYSTGNCSYRKPNRISLTYHTMRKQSRSECLAYMRESDSFHSRNGHFLYFRILNDRVQCCTFFILYLSSQNPYYTHSAVFPMIFMKLYSSFHIFIKAQHFRAKI